MSRESQHDSRRIGNILDRVKIAGQKVGMKVYHETTELNYKKEILSRKRETPSGSYKSFELATGHKSDLLLSEISDRAGSQETIYDIGAYSGDYTIPLASDHPDRTVVAFEPDETTRQRLYKNLGENDVEGDVIVKPHGVGSTSEYKKFYMSSFRKISSFNREDATRWGASVIDTQETQIKTMDELSKSLPKPDHVKIDAEGYAPEILYGSTEMIKDINPIFYIEPHDRECADRTESILKWCEENDYRSKKKKSVILCHPV